MSNMIFTEQMTHLSHVISQTRAHMKECGYQGQESYPVVLKFLHAKAGQSFLCWLVTRNEARYSERAMQLMKLRTSTVKPWVQGVEPDLAVLEAAVRTQPTNKTLLLCILRHMSASSNIIELSQRDENGKFIHADRCIDLALQMIRKSDLSVVMVLFAEQSQSQRTFDAQTSAQIWQTLLSRDDLSFPQRLAWLTIFRKYLRLDQANGEWVEWLSRANIGPEQQIKILRWRLDAGVSGRPGNTLPYTHVPPHESNEDRIKRRNALHSFDSTPYDAILDVSVFERARDLERGRPDDAKFAVDDKIRADMSTESRLRFQVPWGQTEQKCPFDRDVMGTVCIIRWFLERKIFRPQSKYESESYQHSCMQLIHAQHWFDNGFIDTLATLKMLQADFPQYLTDDALGVGSLTYVNWLASRGEWDELRKPHHWKKMNSYTLTQVIRSRTNLENPKTFDFLLDAMNERPELVDPEEVMMSAHQELLACAPPVVIFLFYALGGASGPWNQGCEIFIQDKRITGNYCFSPMDVEERWAMVSIMYNLMGRRSCESWFTSLVSSTPKEEASFWLEWSVSRGFRRNCDAVRMCMYNPQEQAIQQMTWFREHGFSHPNLSMWVEYQTHGASRMAITREVHRLWPSAFKSQHGDLVKLALGARDMVMVHFLVEEVGLTLLHIEGALNLMHHTSNHHIKCDKDHTLWIRKDLELSHFEALEWLFTKHAVEIALLYEKAQISCYGGRLPEFTEESAQDLSSYPYSDVQRKSNEWVHAHCAAVVLYTKRCKEAIAKRELEEVERQAKYAREQEKYRYGYGYDSYDSDCY